MNYKEEMELKHVGVMGMKWGKSRTAKREQLANKLSTKYGVKVAPGIKKSQVKNALKSAEMQKKKMASIVIEDHANKTVGFYGIVGVKQMSQKQFDTITNKANKTLDSIGKLKVSEIKLSSEKGKKIVEVVMK